MTSSRVRPSESRHPKRPARRPKRVDAAFVEAAALSYLDRFDATAQKLRDVLMRRCRTELQRHTELAAEELPQEAELRSWVEALIARYQQSGLIDDRRFAHQVVASLRARGSSSRNIAFKLRQKGVDATLIEELLVDADSDSPEAELEAARRLIRRRRLMRRAGDDPNQQRKVLATLARAGFSFEVARQAMQAEES